MSTQINPHYNYDLKNRMFIFAPNFKHTGLCQFIAKIQEELPHIASVR